MEDESVGGGPASALDWPSDWMRAILGALTLRALEQGPSYGYAIITDLAARGMGTVKGGTLYPLLTRFEALGLVAVEWKPGEGGPGRKYFSLTPQGRDQLEQMRGQWTRFTAISNHYMTGTREESDHA